MNSKREKKKRKKNALLKKQIKHIICLPRFTFEKINKLKGSQQQIEIMVSYCFNEIFKLKVSYVNEGKREEIMKTFYGKQKGLNGVAVDALTVWKQAKSWEMHVFSFHFV